MIFFVVGSTRHRRWVADVGSIRRFNLTPTLVPVITIC